MKKYILFILSSMLMVVSCTSDDVIYVEDEITEEEVIVDNSAFNVSLRETKVYNVGERVDFDIVGNPESINFYSGEYGHEYQFRDGRPQPSGMDLSFMLYTAQPTSRSHLFLYVSTDFDGDYSSYASIQEATWTDITNRIAFPTAANAYTNVGTLNLSDLVQLDKPVYLAFRYVNTLVSGVPVTWYIRQLIWNSVVVDVKEQIGALALLSGSNINTMDFRIIHKDPTKPNTIAGATNQTDRFTMNGVAASPLAETWIVSKGFNGVKPIIGKGDTALPIKSAGNPALHQYRHVYGTSGTYKVSFVGVVKEADGSSKNVVKEMDVVVQ